MFFGNRDICANVQIYPEINKFDLEEIDINFLININKKKLNLSFQNKTMNKFKNYEIIKCTECSAFDCINDNKNGVVVCSQCGNIICNLLYEGVNWNYNNNDKGINNGTPTDAFLPQMSLCTSIRCNKYSQLNKINSWNSIPHKERSLNKIYGKIHKYCLNGNFNKSIEEDAKIYYTKISQFTHLDGKYKGNAIITRGKKRTNIIAGCIYHACIKNNVIVSANEIALLFNITSKRLTQGYNRFLKIMKCFKFNINDKILTPIDFINKFCKELNLNSSGIEKTINIYNNIKKFKHMSIHDPITFALGSILLMAIIYKIDYINKKELSRKFGISVATMQKFYRKIITYKNIIEDNSAVDLEINKNIKKISPDIEAKINKNIKKVNNKFYDINVEIKKIKGTGIYTKNYIKKLDKLQNMINTIN